MATAELKLKVDEQSLERLDELARATGRSTAAIAADAIQSYLDVQTWQMRAIERGLASLDAGLGVPHEDVETWLAQLPGQHVGGADRR